MTNNHFSTIAILGGAGKAGRPLVAEALEAGYYVRLLLRHPDQFTVTHKRLTVMQGDARDSVVLRQLLVGSDALISTLGNPKGENTPMLSAVTEQILTLMPTLGISRYVAVTSLYETGREQIDQATKQASDYMQRLYPAFMADRQREFQLLAQSPVDWTYVRLPYVVQEPATGRVSVHLDHLPGSQITSADLARFLVVQLTSRAYVRQAPFVANGG